MGIELDTLGGLRAFLDGEELTSLPRRPVQCALLTYLAIERSATRDTLLALLWPEKSDTRARRSLNNTVYELRSVLGPDWLRSSGEQLVISDSVSVDAHLFESAIESGEFADALALHHGEFLEGLHLAQTTAFEQWVDRKRATLTRSLQKAYGGRVETLRDAAETQAAIDCALAWTAVTPHDEEAHYWLLRLMAEAGHRAQALRRFERFRNALHEEFGVEPARRLAGLMEDIREGKIRPRSGQPGSQPAPPRLVDPPPSETPRPPDVESGSPTGRETPDGAWRPTPGVGRRLFRLIGGYALAAGGLLQGLDLLIGYYPALPRSFFRAALVLLLCGLPIVLITAFFQQHPVQNRRLQGIRFFVARWFSWRNAALGAFAALAAWTAAAVGWLLVGPGFGSPTLDANRAIVFPFASTRAIDDPSAGWDVALAIGGALEHTEPLRFIDGREWLEDPYRDVPESLTPGVAASVARERGAAFYIDGALRSDGPNLSVTVRVHDVSGDSIITQQTVHGPADERSLPQLALAAIREVLVRIVEPSQTSNVAALEERSPASIALWLQGEREFRQSRFSEALVFFQRAVDEDSLHAFAAIKGAQAASWVADYTTSEELIQLALEHESQLPGKYRRLARGYERYLAGDADQAVSEFLEALVIDDSWAEAAMAMGDTYYHLLPSDATNPDSITNVWFMRAWNQDPSFAPPLYHLTQIRIRAAQTDEARKFMESWDAFEPDEVLHNEVEASLACVERGADNFLWSPGPDDVRYVLQAAMQLAGAGAQTDCAQAAFRSVFELDVGRAIRWTALKGLFGLAISGGRFDEAERLVREGIDSGIGAAATLYVYGMLAGAPFEVQAAATEASLRRATGDLYGDSPAGWKWLMGTLLAHTGEFDRLTSLVEQMESVDSVGDARSSHLLAKALRARLSVAAGDTTEAIEILSALVPIAPTSLITFDESASLGPERLLHAELLLKSGRPREALRVAALIDHPTPDIYPVFLARSLELRLRATNLMGDTEDAAAIERRLVELGHTSFPASPVQP